MRIVIDTDVIMSGLYDPESPPGRVLRAGALGRLELCAPESVRREFERVLVDVLEFGPADIGRIVERLPIEWLEEAIYRGSLAEARRVLRDPTDAPVLACGFALGVDVVSGDKDLHAANQRRIKVWRPADL